MVSLNISDTHPPTHPLKKKKKPPILPTPPFLLGNSGVYGENLKLWGTLPLYKVGGRGGECNYALAFSS